MSLVESARAGRASGATLKAELSNLRSRFPLAAIFIFEGRDDYGPYEVWLTRINDAFDYKALCGKGKGQLLDLRRRLSSDTTGLRENSYFFVDKDFDDLRGQNEGADIHVTETYSIENHFVCNRVIRSILLDEFRIEEGSAEFERVLEQFENHCVAYSQLMYLPNLRMFMSARLQTHDGYIERRITRYLKVEATTLSHSDDFAKIDSLVPLKLWPEKEVEVQLKVMFDRLEARSNYNGKLWLSFLVLWLSKVADVRKRGETDLFDSPANISFNHSELTLRSFASRCHVPQTLVEFVQPIVSKQFAV